MSGIAFVDRVSSGRSHRRWYGPVSDRPVGWYVVCHRSIYSFGPFSSENEAKAAAEYVNTSPHNFLYNGD